MVDVLSNGDGSAVHVLASFTKRGIVVAAAKVPKTDGSETSADRFLDSVDLSGRK